MKEFLQANAFISEYQSGFRKQRRTVSAALRVGDDIIMETKLMNPVLISQRLPQTGATEHAVHWFFSYLTNGTPFVPVNSLYEINGVPQGSLLGPFLVLILLNTSFVNTNTCTHIWRLWFVLWFIWLCLITCRTLRSPVSHKR